MVKDAYDQSRADEAERSEWEEARSRLYESEAIYILEDFARIIPGARCVAEDDFGKAKVNGLYPRVKLLGREDFETDNVNGEEILISQQRTLYVSAPTFRQDRLDINVIEDRLRIGNNIRDERLSSRVWIAPGYLTMQGVASTLLKGVEHLQELNDDIRKSLFLVTQQYPKYAIQ